VTTAEAISGKSVDTEPVVSATGISRRFGEADTAVDALKDVDIAFRSGGFTAVMGPSGSGKSTLMHILAGLDRPTAGTVRIDGQVITSMGDRQLTLLRRKKVGFVFQFFNLLPTLTAEENIVLPARIGGTKVDPAFFSEIVEAMGLRNRLTHRPSQLSGGQQQRVAIARALITRPAVIFADEPTGNLDSTASGEVLTLLRHAVDDFKQTIIVVTHDAVAAARADRIVFLADGRIVKDQPASSVGEILDQMKELR